MSAQREVSCYVQVMAWNKLYIFFRNNNDLQTIMPVKDGLRIYSRNLFSYYDLPVIREWVLRHYVLRRIVFSL